MKALVLVSNGVLEVRNVPLPPRPEGRWLLLRVRFAGICGSDFERGFGGKAYHYPLIMGHEFSGTVEEAPPGSPFAPGEVVTVYPLLPCGRCGACRTGHHAQCADYDYLGSRRDGAFAEYLWVPEGNGIPVPRGVEPLHAAMTEPAAVAYHGVSRLALRGGETAVVFGAGPIGVLCAQWLRIRGCRRVLLMEVDPRKRRIAEDMGFLVHDSAAGDPVEAVDALTGGEGAAAAVEACGLPATYLAAVRSVGRFGQVVFVGNIRGDFVLPEKEVSNLLRREITLRGAWNSRDEPRGADDWSTVLSFLGRELDVAPLISHQPALDEGPDVFRRALSRTEFFHKIVFRI
jgi:L-iditol 2-dehydrogenase